MGRYLAWRHVAWPPISELYKILQRKDVFVALVLGSSPFNIEFRRAIVGDKRTMWLHLVHRLVTINLSQEPDVFHWKIHTSGVFSVKSMYADLINIGLVFRKKYIWKIKVLLKIKIFMWYFDRGVDVKKDNLAKRRWEGCKKLLLLWLGGNKISSIPLLPVCRPNLAHHQCSL